MNLDHTYFCLFRNCVNLLSVLHLGEEGIELKLRSEFKFKPKAAEFIEVTDSLKKLFLKLILQ